MKSKFEKSILVELKITSVGIGTNISFNDVPQLRGKYIQAVEVFTATQVAKTQTQQTTVADAGKNGILVNLDVDSDVIIENIPYYTLISSNNGGLIREFKNLKLNINKSNIYIGDPTNIVVNTCALFCFYYTDKPIN